MPLQNGLEILVQTEQPGGLWACDGFAGMPAPDPVQIVIITAHQSAGELARAQHLRSALCQALSALSVAATPPLPCVCTVPGSPQACHAFARSKVRVVLAYLSEPGSTSPPVLPGWYPRSVRGAPVAHDATVPIIPAGSNVPTLLPPALLAANLFVKEVHVDVSEAVPDVLAAGGVVSDEFRLFISYRWQEAAAVADQIFDALSHVNFDVFLDRFRQAPGNNFALRINEALADMAFVLVLETPLIAQSPWVGLEVAYARNNRLGLLALQLPRGVALPQIRQSERKSLRANDLVAGGALVPQACADLVQWVRVEHGRALAERQRYVRNNMRDAILDRNGIVIAGRSGLLHTAGGVGGVATYGVRVTARTPALGDFHDCDGAALLGEKRVIVGPIVQLRQLRASRLQWLRRRTGVELFDEADMVDVAEDMVGGVL